MKGVLNMAKMTDLELFSSRGSKFLKIRYLDRFVIFEVMSEKIDFGHVGLTLWVLT